MEHEKPVYGARSPKYNLGGTIDCEILHPEFGWVPFTASPDDPEEMGRTMYAIAIDGAYGPIAPYGGQTPEEASITWKAEREAAVSSIKVTVDGMEFDGDEISQGRIARAVVGLQSRPDGSTVQWVLSDNTVVQVGLAVLQEALTLAGLRQTELWIKA